MWRKHFSGERKYSLCLLSKYTSKLLFVVCCLKQHTIYDHLYINCIILWSPQREIVKVSLVLSSIFIQQILYSIIHNFIGTSHCLQARQRWASACVEKEGVGRRRKEKEEACF